MDPIEARRQALAATLSEAAAEMTFSQCASAYIAAHKPSWHNDKHANQWDATLATYAEPVFGHRSVKKVDIEASREDYLARSLLEPVLHIWREYARSPVSDSLQDIWTTH